MEHDPICTKPDHQKIITITPLEENVKDEIEADIAPTAISSTTIGLEGINNDTKEATQNTLFVNPPSSVPKVKQEDEDKNESSNTISIKGMYNDPSDTIDSDLQTSPILEPKVKHEVEEDNAPAEASKIIDGVIEIDDDPWGSIKNPHTITSSLLEVNSKQDEDYEKPISSRLRPRRRSFSTTSPPPVDLETTCKKMRKHSNGFPHIRHQESTQQKGRKSSNTLQSPSICYQFSADNKIREHSNRPPHIRNQVSTHKEIRYHLSRDMEMCEDSNTLPHISDQGSTHKEMREHSPTLIHIRTISESKDIIVTPITISELPENVCNGNRRKRNKSSSPARKEINTTTILNLLQFSTLTPFLNRKGVLSCFYCTMEFGSMETLKEHSSKYKDFEIEYVLNRCKLNDNFILYADINDLSCKICNASIPTLDELKTHLSTVHEKEVNDIDRVIPFKMPPQNYKCQMCDLSFATFGSIEEHMNVHFNHYGCNNCEMGFATRDRLKMHVKSVHATLTCKTCNKVFNDRQEYVNHVNAVRNIAKSGNLIKCRACPKSFTDNNERLKHIDQHHNGQQYKCDRLKHSILDTLSIKFYSAKDDKKIQLKKILPRDNGTKS